MSDIRVAAPHRLAAIGWIVSAALAVAGLAHAYNLVLSLQGPEEHDGRVVFQGTSFGLSTFATDTLGSTVLTAAQGLVLVLFIVWLYLARDNFDRRGGGAEWHKAWTIGGWFVPIANLGIPNRVVADVHRRSAPDGSWPTDRIVNAWWGALLVSFISLTDTTRYADGTVTVHTPAFVGVVAGGAGILAAVLGVVLVRRISAWQDAALAT
ncbi:DUF4328 domain-containing protein [Dactylosporangium sp. NPDC049525]|uniref:DUF4328 domain-containing protein n=1 Tax=Dactylosporangium sp. NPDC049525 TaxID=3154730 RepID=UPI00343D052E